MNPALRKEVRDFLFVNLNLDIAGAGGDFAFAAGYGFGNIDISGVGSDNEYLIRLERSFYIAGVGFNSQLSRITAVQRYMSGGPFNGEVIGCNHIFQNMLAGSAFYSQALALNIGKFRFSGGFCNLQFSRNCHRIQADISRRTG